ncbi:HNH endonuclease signature motif containing protein [Pseudolysinimonas yzui]|uniref:HNH nuclease domain-containing protein n=1 Tax=Pseudolysinimonas yzui TaxID=2708254 RepID=A0A8J3GN29_9MICO|nr:HNH endonuclease signature motif containing protein [Pseudolysinimonas yzui]GHF05717.1 hypothetical protein GCM10011600_02820 [Pseudolysinimonas yzui]
MPAVATVIELPELSGLPRASDAELERLLGKVAAAKRQVDACAAVLAGEVERRSDRELGYSGLAQRSGDRTADGFVARVTGASGVEARQLVTVGKLLDAPSPWFADVAAAVTAGDVSVGAAAAITSGLGTPSASVSPDALLDAAQQLVTEMAGLPPEKVARRAREVRDELDAAGVADREALLRSKRFLRLTPQADGMTRIFGMLDPVQAALVTDAIDCVTAPRRGGPRFVDPDELARVDALEKDPRTTEQIAVDALVEMIRIAGAADPDRVFGVRKPAVRVHVDSGDLASGDGYATIEGQTATISIATAEGLACADGYQTIVFHADGTVDVGRTQRLFTERQRIALAAVWGGCAVETCDRPPSWTEAHHSVPWSHGGRTDIADGILLCRHHHMLLHNNNWRINRPPGRRHTGWSMTSPDGRTLRLVTKNALRTRQLTRTP